MGQTTCIRRWFATGIITVNSVQFIGHGDESNVLNIAGLLQKQNDSSAIALANNLVSRIVLRVTLDSCANKVHDNALR